MILAFARKWLLLAFAFLVALPILLPSSVPQAAADASGASAPFSWNNATVYFAMTDRFYDGDSTNNNSYGRVSVDATGSKIGTYQGGDIKGLTQKLQEGYFTDLGVNAIWVTAPYEQIHGWVGGGSGGDFAHYAYHGYYALDYTEMDKNVGTVEEFRTFVDLAHSQGIRVVLDVVMNHVGYATLKDMETYGFGSKSVAASWTPASGQTWHSYLDYVDYTNATTWVNWWGSWVRAGIGGYTACGGDDKTMCLSGLPDVRTDVTSSVGLPAILQTKWAQETTGYSNWIVPASVSLRQNLNVAPADYIVKWLAAWVREFGIDGFRVDTAKHVELTRWQQLKTEADAALDAWRLNNPTKPGAAWTDDFWITAEVWGHGVGRSDYFNYGIDSVINFTFQNANFDSLEGVYSSYAAAINASPRTFNSLSYISSHDTSLYNRSNLIKAGTGLLLVPGGAQIFYGDETARPAGPTSSDSTQATRSFMNWSAIDTSVLSHWQKLGQFRRNHLAVGAGVHQMISSSPYTFSRVYTENGADDRVVVAIGASGTASIDVSSVFDDGATVRDAYTGNTAVVANGTATFAVHANGVVLIEQIAPSNLPSISVSPTGGVFKTETQTVTLTLARATSGLYTLDGSDPAVSGTSFVSGDTVTFGSDMAFTESKTLKVYAVNEYGSSSKQYVYTKKDPNAQIHVHFKKPSSWSAPQLYFYETSPAIAQPTWATAPAMTLESGSWYVYTFTGIDSARVLFKDSSGHQIPGSGAAGILVTADGWYSDQWYSYNPETPDPTPPTAPANLTAGTVTASSAALSWTAATDNLAVTGYNVYRDGTLIGTSTGTTYTATGLAPSTTYAFTVKAYDSSGNLSDASNEISVTTSAGNTVTIYYKRGFSAPYIHYRPAGGTWTTAPGVAIPASEYAAYNKITINIGSAAQLEACFNNGSGNWDNNGGSNYLFGVGTWTYIPTGSISSGAPNVDTTAPSAPSNVTASAVSATTATVNWTASTDNVAVTGYNVYRNGTLAGSVTGTGYTDTGLSASTTYSYSVKAYDAEGNLSDAGVAASVTTPAGNTATIYYKNASFGSSYIHYKIDGSSTWTTTPGVLMTSSSYAGYSMATVQLGSATGLTAAFTNGTGTWDNNGGSNYHFGTGDSSLVNGNLYLGTPQADSVTFVVTVPSTTPSSGPVYISGTFNGWDPAAAAYQLTKNANTYSITLNLTSGTAVAYKFTRGAWANVETASGGADIANRTLTPSGGPQTVNLTVAKWKDL